MPETNRNAGIERVIEELRRIAFADYSDYVQIVEEADVHGGTRAVLRLTPTDKLPRRKRAAIASLKQIAGGIEIKLYDKAQALRILARLLDAREEEGKEGEGKLVIVDDI